VVAVVWNETEGGYKTFSDRLQACGDIFKKWECEKFRVLSERAKSLQKKFQKLRKVTSNGQNIQQLREIEFELL